MPLDASGFHGSEIASELRTCSNTPMLVDQQKTLIERQTETADERAGNRTENGRVLSGDAQAAVATAVNSRLSRFESRVLQRPSRVARPEYGLSPCCSLDAGGHHFGALTTPALVETSITVVAALPSSGWRTTRRDLKYGRARLCRVECAIHRGSARARPPELRSQNRDELR